jgi:hypothetical protein
VTAHRQKPITLTPEVIALFDAYQRREPCWGILHVQFDDGNTDIDATFWRDVSDEERELVRLYNLMSRSQRERLRKRF